MDQQPLKRKRKIRWGNWVAWTIGAAFWLFVCGSFFATVGRLIEGR